MSFWEKFKAGLRRAMEGRNGSDELSFALLILALALTLVSTFTGSALLNLLSLVAYILCIYRMFSRKIDRRQTENQRYVLFRQKAVTACKQGWVRLKNIRRYKYFRCPECKSLLRLPRKVGEVTVTCGKCHHAFKQKA